MYLQILGMNNSLFFTLLVIVILIIASLFLYNYGNKMLDKQQEAKRQAEIGAQQVSLLVIDKKRMKMTEANLPQLVIDSTPKHLRRTKVPVVKVKYGPKVMSMICDESIFDLIPVKQEVKATVNGIYILSVKGLRGALDKPTKKKGFFAKMKDKAYELREQKK